jgi:hypothetical protein
LKYTKIVCFVRPQDRKELEDEIKDIPLIFANSLRDFAKKITDDSYLIMSLGYITDWNVGKFKRFVRKFPNNIFNLYGLKMLEEQTAKQTEIMF